MTSGTLNMKQLPGTEINTIPFTLLFSNMSEKSSRNKKITHELMVALSMGWAKNYPIESQ